MHELSIAMSIVDVAGEEALRRDLRVSAVHVRIGPLSGVVCEALAGAFEMAREGSPLAEATLIITQTPIVAWCSQCQCERQIPSMQLICCPVCGTPTPRIVGGRELEVTGLEIFDDAADSTRGSSPESPQAE